jgi:hypothetical protein
MGYNGIFANKMTCDWSFKAEELANVENTTQLVQKAHQRPSREHNLR